MDYPLINFGTYRLEEKDIEIGLESALKYGYRSIDTASLYKNEKFIGNYLTKNDISRNEIWLTSKLNPRIVHKSETDIIKSITNTLTELNTNYLDLYLIHAPNEKYIEKIWSILEQFKRQGIFKNIGVSNFKICHLEKLKEISNTEIFTNQIEVSPFLTRTELITYMNDNKIPISAHSSLIKAEKMDNSTLQRMAFKYQKTPAQILLKWALQKGFRVIPRSSNPEHIKENILLKFVLEEEDIAILDTLNCDYYTHPQYK
jgi:diketogulonate reductase-like aldo/keto reductase